MTKIHDKRIAIKMTQAELAKAVGVSQAAVAQWENGQTSPTVSKLKQIARVLKCKVGDLL